MAERKFKLTAKQSAQLHQAFLRCAVGETRTRYQAVRLYGMGYPVAEIQTLTGCSRTRLMIWSRTYRSQGLRALEDHRCGGNARKLSEAQYADLKRRLYQYTPRDLFGSSAHSPTGQFWTLPDLRRAIWHWYGIEYRSHSTLRNVFHRCAFSYQRPARVFKSKRLRQVMEFEEQLEKNSLTLHKLDPKPQF